MIDIEKREDFGNREIAIQEEICSFEEQKSFEVVE
jgi:hypothetical protein